MVKLEPKPKPRTYDVCMSEGRRSKLCKRPNGRACDWRHSSIPFSLGAGLLTKMKIKMNRKRLRQTRVELHRKQLKMRMKVNKQQQHEIRRN